ncbi:MAG TPA: DNA polymerase III subunit epsilon, partial [Saprospiraceae bacterium]|nr:DNA polymerase III subunit epsilon [Saprospiraceae bacterium]
LSEHPAIPAARGRLEWAVEQFELCRRLSGLETGKGACFHFHLKKCRGACAGQESAADYNERAQQAAERLQTGFEEDFLLMERGRTPQERAVVLVQDGQLAGYGYVETSEGLSLEELLEAVRHIPGNPETTRIIQGYLHRRPVGLKRLDLNEKR